MLLSVTVPDGSVVLVAVLDTAINYSNDVATVLGDLLGREFPVIGHQGIVMPWFLHLLPECDGVREC